MIQNNVENQIFIIIASAIKRFICHENIGEYISSHKAV